MRQAHLESWFLTPCAQGYQLVGYVSGHPAYSDGTRVRTSTVLKYNADEHQAHTRNTEYTLGNPANLPETDEAHL